MFTRQKAKFLTDELSSEGFLPLHQAVEDGNENLVDKLLASGGLPDVQNSSGETPIHYAVLMGRINILRKLVSACSVPDKKHILDIPDIKDKTGVYLAIWKGQADVLRILLEGGAKVDGPFTRFNACTPVREHGQYYTQRNSTLEVLSPLMMAANVGFVEGIKLLIKFRTNVNQHNKDGKTALYYACKNGHNECLDILLQAKANPNLPKLRAKISISQPLIMATNQGNMTAIRLLLKHRADVDIQDSIDNSSALILAAERKSHNCKECVQLLLEHSADVNALNRDGKNAAMVAATVYNSDALRYMYNIQ